MVAALYKAWPDAEDIASDWPNGIIGSIEQIIAERDEAMADKARLDFLETKTVNVREPLPYGSSDLFWSSPDDSFEGEDGPSDIRAKIDARLSQKGGRA